MNEALAIVIAAGITAIGGVCASAVSSFKKMREENKADHGMVMQKLDSVGEKIESVSERLDGHIEWHMKK